MMAGTPSLGGTVSEESRALPASHRTKRRHASGAHRGPDSDLLAEAGLILLFLLVFGGFFATVATLFGI
jgi:hypothetical protein